MSRFGDGVQATLLSFAIALILALVTALVGPHFVDWNKYRGEFEAQASRMTGLQVRVAGPIDAKLLPTPSLILNRIDIVRPGDAGSLRARKLSIEFSLGSLIRGDWKATDVRVEGAEISLALDQNGRLEWPAPSIDFDPDSISIERLDIRDSRALVADTRTGSGVVLDQLEFNGELRTLAGPIKGQGSFYLAGMHYPYRIAASRSGDDRVRIRINVDPIDRPLTADADGLLFIENGMPRFAGSVTMARAVTRAPPGSSAEIIEPWRLTGKIDGSSTRAVIEQIEFQYGSDERPIRLRGDASVMFGASPRLTGVLSSAQVDLDRILGLPEAQRRRPLASIKSLADSLLGPQSLPIPTTLGLSIESLTVAGATIQRFGGEFTSNADGWTIDNVEMRAPGLTQMSMAGRVGVSGDGLSFAGRTKVESKDPRALIAWLSGRANGPAITANSLSVDGDFRLSSDEIAVDHLKAELDRMTVAGRLSYAWAKDGRPPRIEAVVSAPDIDLDRAHGLLRGLFDGTVFDWPREGVLSATIDRATLAGVEAMRANVNMRFNADGLDIERLAIGDFGGVAVAVRGNIDTRARAPRGALTLDLEARRLDGVTALLERLSPRAAEEVRRNAARFAPAKLSATLRVGAGTAQSKESSGRFEIDGNAGALRIKLHGDVGATGGELDVARLSRLRTALVNLEGVIESAEGDVLVAVIGLGPYLATERAPGRISVTARGPLDGDMAVASRLVAGGLDVSAKGKVRVAGSQGPTADMELTVANANLRTPRSSSRPAEVLPVALTTRLAFAEGVVNLTDLTGKVAGSDVSGRLAIGFENPLSINGSIALGSASLPAAIGAVIGLPRSQASAWAAEPFEPGLIGSVDGTVRLRIGRVALSPQLNVQDLRGVLQFGEDTIGVAEIDGSVAGGRLAGSLSFERGDEGLTLSTNTRWAGVNIGDLLPGDAAIRGRATIDLDLSGTGRSLVALIGSLKGEGTFTLQDGQILRINPAAFEAVMRNVDVGLPVDAGSIRDHVEAALNNGALGIALAQGEIAVAAGQLRLANTAVRATGAELGVSLSVDLSGSVMDARLALTGPIIATAPSGTRPELTVSWRGPIGAPKRAVDVAAFSNWLALRAIEEKDKRINALQTGREVPVPPTAPPQSSMPPAVAPERSAPETPPQVAPRVTRPKAPTAKASPPPPDLRPSPTTRQQTLPRQQSQPSRPPATRSWLENLFGP